MKFTKMFLLNLLHRLPVFLVFVFLGIALLQMGSSPRGQESVWIAETASVIPIILILGGVIMLVSCILGIAKRRRNEPGRDKRSNLA